MLEKARVASSQLSESNVINEANAELAVRSIDPNSVDFLLVTDNNGDIIYSTASETQIEQDTYEEIELALNGNDVFYWSYIDSNMKSSVAVPFTSSSSIVGCVYFVESDLEQGTLISSLQKNVLVISLTLEFAVIVFSLFFSSQFSKRLSKIMTSVRGIQSGDYSTRVSIGGHDELSFLGDEINYLTERLQTSEKKRQQFVSDASHELKTPLASIKLLSDSILQNSMDEETTREFVEDIGNEAERLNRLSQKLLTLTRTNESSMEDESEIITIAPTITRVVKMLTGIAEQNNITIITELSDDYSILIPEDDLYQVAFNLAENGIKYNTNGGTLTISVRGEEENAIISFSDTGPGIPEESLPHIFERFYRVDKARSRKSGGSGLGLAIVRNIVKKNRGEIKVDSKLGEGTHFEVSFPIFEVGDSVPEEINSLI